MSGSCAGAAGAVRGQVETFWRKNMDYGYSEYYRVLMLSARARPSVTNRTANRPRE